MPLPFDTGAEDEKLAMLRAREEEDLAQILSGKYGLTYKDLTIIPVNMDAVRLLSEEEAKTAEAVVFDRNGRHVLLALRNPQNTQLEAVRKSLIDRGYILEEFLVSQKSLDHVMARYVDLSYATVSEAGVFNIPKDELDSLSKKLASIAEFQAHLDGLIGSARTGTSELFEEIMVAALAMNASDVHIEPEEANVRLRLRLDGLLTNAYVFDEHMYKSLVSRIKLLSGLKLNITDRAQDGRLTISVGSTDVEIRTSIIPGGYGESVVLRILNPESIAVSFDELGIHPKLLERLKREIKRPNGMLLTTGPTGSGKTTSLYAFLRYIHTPDIKIITIEDPIEYHLPGIVQTQTDEEYTFESGLRSILRQDPDVIMVGEIRDREVADTAMQAALTGHFVFSTLHTNNAAGTFPRLVDLGIDPRTFSSAITVAMAQRLVRRLDPNKRKQIPLEGDSRAMVDEILSTVSDASLLPASRDMVWVPDTSETDDPTVGYSGRVGLYEAIFMDESFGSFLRDNPSESEIAEHARGQGYLTMAQDGVLKALQGLTTLDEVFKVVVLPPCTTCVDGTLHTNAQAEVK